MKIKGTFTAGRRYKVEEEVRIAQIAVSVKVMAALSTSSHPVPLSWTGLQGKSSSFLCIFVFRSMTTCPLRMCIEGWFEVTSLNWCEFDSNRAVLFVFLIIHR